MSALDPRQQLEDALRWLKSHHKRLVTRERSLAGELEEVAAELKRVEREMEAARSRLGVLRDGGDSNS